MPTAADIRKQITDKIVAALASNLVPWRRPWSLSANAGRPANFVSQRPYSGINPILLQLHALQHGFSSKWWGTFDQIKELGGMVRRRPAHVRSGEWGCRIVFMRPVMKRVKDEATGDERDELFSVMRTYTVFNVDQADGEKLDRFRVDADADLPPETNDEPIRRMSGNLPLPMPKAPTQEPPKRRPEVPVVEKVTPPSVPPPVRAQENKVRITLDVTEAIRAGIASPFGSALVGTVCWLIFGSLSGAFR